MFNLDVIQDEADRAPWEFEFAGRRWKLPHVSDLTLDEQEALDRGATKPVIRARAVEVTEQGDVPGGDALAQLWGARKGSTTGRYLAAWLAHAGMEQGESGASSR